MAKIHKNVNGQPYKIKRQKPGPKPRGLSPVLVDLPDEYLAALKARKAECGGYLSVNEQIRQAVRAYLLGGLVYINRLNT